MMFAVYCYSLLSSVTYSEFWRCACLALKSKSSIGDTASPNCGICDNAFIYPRGEKLIPIKAIIDNP